MAKRRSREHLAVSLFPFLSILACVIGVLTLMITALALGQINHKAVNQHEIDRAEEYLKTKKQTESESARVAQMQRTFAKAKELETQTQKSRTEREALEQQKKELEKPSLSAAQLAAQAEQLRKNNETMDRELKELLTELAPLREQAARIPPKEGEGKITVRPGGTGTNLKPTFVECAAAGIVLHEPPRPVVVPSAAVAGSAAFAALLDRVAQQEDGTVIFLVRPDGIATYNQARALARARYARNGKLPLPGDGPIDLSLFGGK